MNVASNGDVVIITCYGVTTTKYYIIRSDDAGATWSVIGRRDTEWTTFIEPHPNYNSLNSDEDVFIFTSCGSYVDGTNNLGYLISFDDGITWEVREMPLSKSSGVPSYGAIPTLPDEPQVWSI